MVDLNYTDRKVDISITTNYQGLLEFKIPNKVTSGIQKVVQMFILELFTALDSNIFNNNGGTYFGSVITNKEGTPYKGLMSHYISAAISTVVETLSQEKSVSTDENIASAIVEDFTEDKTSATVKILLTTEAGTSHSFLVPISLSDLPL